MSGTFSNNPIGGSPLGPDMSSGAEQGGMGKISGPMLTRNLYRNGVDLAFRNTLSDTQLLYIDVNNNKIGVNTGTPTEDLDVDGTTQTVDLIGTYGRIAGFTIDDSTFSAIGNIELNADTAVVAPALDNGTIFIDGNYISTSISNANIDISPYGVVDWEKVANAIILTALGATDDISNFFNSISPVTGFSYGDVNQTGSITTTDARDALLYGSDPITYSAFQTWADDLTSVLEADYERFKSLFTGNVEIVNDLNVYGNLYTPKNITLEGTITFGNQDTDAVDFNADVNSDIIPDQTDTYNLGSTTKRWQNLYTNLVNGQSVSTSDLSVGLINYTKTQGNIIYVAQNGSDVNRGDHILAPVSSIRRALELVDASIGAPTAIYVFPGDYEEETPLVVPSNVSIIGTDLRNVNIFPTSYTLSEDVFHLNGETTVANLTVKNFYYDDNKGYAFRFAPDAVISSRSPYIQNVTVITQGSSITVDDPRGFDSGDAGRGAYIDGAELNSASVDASMLFHSCTFITPGVDCITMTNGVRVEWLNSFTYFANRGLYAFNNSTGRVSNDGSTVNYGAEVRSIGSANIYGNYGAVADGADCLMYLIQHNFAYVGTGKDFSNDNGLVIQENEVVEENSGQIHYVTTDHTGAFRVGDNFFIDFETGSTSVDLSALTADSLTGLVITNGADRTFITGERIETGNIKISGNTIESLTGDVTLSSATDEIDLNNNANVSGNLDITGNLTFGGNLNLLGNQTSDTLKFNVDFDQDFNPNQTLAFKLGSPTKEWLIAHLSELNAGDIRIYDTVIETTSSNSDLELRANGTGVVNLRNSTNISNDLVVSGLFIDNDTITINGNLIQTGGTIQEGSGIIGENLTVENRFTISQSAVLEEITIDDNFITTRSSNADLELRASGTGIIKIDATTEILNDLLVSNISVGSNYTATNEASFNTADVSSIRIENNFITTTTSNANLELRAIAASILAGGSSLTDSGTLVDGGTSSTVSFTSILDGGDAVVELTGSDPVITSPDNVLFDQGLSINGTTYFKDLSVIGNITHAGQRHVVGNYDLSGDLDIDDIKINDNYISTTVSNADLELRAAGIGNVIVPNNDVVISNDLTVSSNTNLQSLEITGLLTQIGNRIQTGDYAQTGNLVMSGDLTVNSKAQFEEILIDGNVITTTESNSDLELRAAGTGEVIVPENNVQVNNNLFAASIIAGNINVDADLVLNEIVIPPSIIDIDDNFITTNESNADLELRASDIVVTSIVLSAFGGNGGASPAYGSTSSSSAGGGAGGYSGNGGNGGTPGSNLGQAGTGGGGGGGYSSNGGGAGGGVGLLGEGASGARGGFSSPGGKGGSGGTDGGGYGGTGGLFGGGGGTTATSASQSSGGGGGLRYVNDIPVTPGDTYTLTIGAGGTAAGASGAGGNGGMRIIWGEGRAYPSTNTADVSDQQVVYDTPGVYEWTVPEGVTSICVVCVGGGASGWGGTNGGNTSFDTLFFAEGGKTPLTQKGTGSGGGGSSEAIINVGGPTGDSNEVSVPSNDVQIDNDLTVNGTTNLLGTSIVGTVTQTGNRTHTGNLTLTGQANIAGLSNLEDDVQFENIIITGNILQTTLSNSNLELRASGTGELLIPNNNVSILQDLSVLQLSSNNITINDGFALELLESSTDIQIFDNVITTTNSNSNLELRANGAGKVLLKDLYFSNNEIQTISSSITFDAQNLNIDSTGSLKLPVGSSAPTSQGFIKFDSLTGLFEGKNTGVIAFGGVYSDNRRTSVIAHPTNNTINLTINNIVVGSVAATGLTIHGIQIDDISLQSGTITTNVSNSDLELVAQGTGLLTIGDIGIYDNVIENSSTGLLTFSNTGFGKIKFNGNAVAIPSGNNSTERPVSPPLGDTRWNTTDQILETWDGSQYISAAGISSAISEAEFNDLLFEYTLIFG